MFKVMEYSHPRNFLEDHFYLNMQENLLTLQSVMRELIRHTCTILMWDRNSSG